MFDILKRLTAIYITVMATRTVVCFINAFQGYESEGRRSNMQQYARSFSSVVKIILMFVAGIVVIAIILNKNPLTLFAGLGALSAVLLLVFQDTITGLVAGIHLTSNDMLRKGDWITVEKAGVNGNVEDMTLTTVKVRNFDNTIVTISPKTLINDSFQNWKGMQESDGRRVRRCVSYDVHSVRIIDDTMRQHLIDKGFFKESELEGREVNLTLFRRYMERYITGRDDVNEQMTYFVTEDEAGPNGIPVEFYFFLKQKKWEDYEHHMSDIMDIIYATSNEFGLSVNARAYPETFSLVLLEWFRENGRQLPWRETTDPYAIWLSEIILQQTRIEQGRPYWERRWPRVEDLAAATEDEVLREWQGLGYYSRARNLHHAAKQVVDLGHFPDTLEGIRKLKGVGDYTAAAIASFAFGIPAAVVDGNVYRVLSRYFGIETPINTTEGKKVFAALAESLLPQKGGEGASYNQAIMDFGAIQCTPQSPRCLICPLMESCEALRSGRVGELPVKLKTLKIRERHFVYTYIRCKGCIAIHRRGPGDIWQGLWEPFISEESRVKSEESLLIRKNVRHVLTHQVIMADFYLCETEERPVLPDGYIWIPEADFDDYAKPRLVEILMESLS